MQRYKRTLLVVLPVLVLLVGSGAYAAINLTAQKPAQHSALKPGINIANGEKGLVGWWKLNGNAKDSTPYADNGTLSSPAPTPTADRMGTANGAYSFNGTNNEIYANSPSILHTSSNPPDSFSISAWFKRTTDGGGDLGGISINANYNARLFYRTINTIAFQLKAASTILQSAPLPLGNWYHATAVWNKDTDKISLYVNGALVGSATPADTNLSGYTQGVWIGNAQNYYEGAISDVRLYNRALSQQDVTNLYNSYNSQVNLCGAGTASCSVNLTAGLIGYWKLDGNGDDSTPYGNNGVVQGGPGPTPTTGRTGAADGAMAFGGTANYSMPNFSEAVLYQGQAGASFTLSVWAKEDGTNVTENVLIGRAGFNSGIETQSSFAYRFALWSSADANGAILATPADMSQWHLLTATYEPGIMKFYLDGQVVGTKTVPEQFVNLHPPLGIGGSGIGLSKWFFNGSLSDARVYNRALSAAEVQALYNLPD